MYAKVENYVRHIIKIIGEEKLRWRISMTRKSNSGAPIGLKVLIRNTVRKVPCIIKNINKKLIKTQ